MRKQIRAMLGTAGLCWLVAMGCSRRETPQPARSVSSASGGSTVSDTNVYALSVNSLEGTPVALSAYRGQVSLIVNVASACGYTPQYAGLERVYQEYKGRGLSVLGFPSNDFGRQEPGTPEQIREFCSSQYRVTFPMFEKVQTKAGPGQSDVYALLGRAGGSLPSWNFGKYLVSRSGKVLKFFPSKVEPESPELIAAIQAALDAS